MDKLLDLIRESVIIQGILTLGLVGAAIGMMLQGREVPRDLWSLVVLVVGFYFGSKVENAKMRKLGR